MCGVFGFIRNSSRIDLDKLERIAVNTESRGTHAHGLAWVTADGRLRQFKAAGRISRNLACFDQVNDARMLIGHCRLATNGDPRQIINNHPHPCDSGWIVHNGIVFNAERLANRFEFPTTSACDSEVIAHLIEALPGDSLLERCQRSMQKLDGPAVVMGLWARPARMMLARMGRPLHLDQDEFGNVYFASLPDGLDDPERIVDNTVRLLEVRQGQIVQTIREIKPCHRRLPEHDPSLGRPLRCYPLDTSASRVPFLLDSK